DRGRVDDQVIFALIGDLDRVSAELLAEVRRAQSGPVPDPDLGPFADQRPDYGPGGAGGPEDERTTPLGRLGERVEEPGRVGVVGVDLAVDEGEGVGGADLTGGLRWIVGDRKRRSLMWDGDIGADEPLARHRVDHRLEAVRRHVDRLVAPLGGEAEV